MEQSNVQIEQITDRDSFSGDDEPAVRSSQFSLVIYAIAMVAVSSFLFVNYPFEFIVVALFVGTLLSMGGR